MENKGPDSQLYHYCIELEHALLDLFGERSRWDNSAAGFRDPRLVKEALLAVARKLWTRTTEVITSDDRLLLTTSLAIEELDRQAKKLREDSNNLLEVIAALLALVVLLLGYDWLTGEPCRHIIYYQTLGQQQADDRHRHPDDVGGPASKREFEKRVEAVARLYDEGFRPAQIGRILFMSEHLAKQLLIRSGKITRDNNIKSGRPTEG